VVFQNRFPSFAGAKGSTAGEAPDGMTEGPAVGRCEVVCFTSDHDSSFSALTPGRVRTVLEAWIDRTRALSALPTVAQVFCFENRGQEIGVTLSHPHGQVYGYPFVTPRTARMLAAAGRHRETTGRNLFADVLSAELAAGDRVVARSRHWTAFVPFAARWPVEVHLYPDIQVARLPALAEEARYDFADLYLEVLHRLEAVHGTDLPYISAWHQAPVRAGEDLGLHLEVSSPRRAPGKLKFLAGSESAMGAFINDIAPEAAARALREAFSQP
jgi:UDPglucose--hexose-1-phosphate uridylyltransferase